jgi:hypothetical protein
MFRTALFAISIAFLAASCSQNVTLQANDFNGAASDVKAIYLAKEVVKSSGGASAWNNTRFLSWNFFGSRKHVWDKQTGNVSIKSLKSPVEIKMNIHDKTGRVWLNGEETMKQDSLNKYLEAGYAWWVNDSYWLVLPFKLMDSGVTLNYLGEGETTSGLPADIISLNFETTGLTPNNKYHVYVDKSTKRINQWDFYTNASDPEPRFQLPWADYQKYGNIYLSGNRGKYELTDIEVGKHLSKTL